MLKKFGIKRLLGGTKSTSQKKKKKSNKKYKRPSDVKVFYVMPFLLILGIILIITSQIMVSRNSKAYQEKVLASSMVYNEKLPLWGGTSKGQLSLGHTLLSEDGKTLVAEIQYDETAHKNMSSFGDRYKLRLVDTEENQMDVQMSYGLFGTDGSGVLTIHSDKGFANKAFIVMVIDNGQLVTTEDLKTNSIMTDSEIDQSITAQLSGAFDSQNSQDNSEKEKLPPLYYLRLNAQSANRSKNNWKTDKQIVTELFVNKNLDKIRNEVKDMNEKIKKGEETLAEMKQRISENPNDNIARTNIQELETSIENLNRNIETANKNLEKIESSVIKDDVLAPKQTKFNKYTVIDINQIK